MKLLIDMGNTAIKWANQPEKKLLGAQQTILHQGDNLDQLLTEAWHKLDKPSQGIWVSNVAGAQKAEILSDWIKTHWELKPNFIKTSSCECGIKNAYDNSNQLGVDRWLAMIGARNLEKGPICVLSCGTAITLDVLFANGHHQGGIIIPGVTSMHNALLSDTQIQFNQTLRQRDKPAFLATNTQSGITLGILYAVMGLLEYVMAHFERQDHCLNLIVTGGSVPALEPLLNRAYRYVPNLVLQGIRVLVSR